MLVSFDLVRSEYGYTDDEILNKTLKWLSSSVDLISRRRYDQLSMQGFLTASFVSNQIMGGKSPPSYDEFSAPSRKSRLEDENFRSDSV